MTNILDNYELGERIFSGGQGLLRRAKRKTDGLDVVVKKYSQMEDAQSWSAYDEGQIGAAREISFLEMAARDGIEGVPKLIEHGITDDWEQPVGIFEPIPGKTLYETVSEPDYKPSLGKALETFGLLMKPLKYAHSKKVVHRDVKPDNIYINGGVVLGDWAAATPTSGKTHHGRTYVTSLHYTAPEVMKGAPFDHRADIYGAAKTLELMILGKDIFENSEGNPTKEDFKKANVPKKLMKALMKATHTKVEKRYSSLDELYNAVESATKGVNLPVVRNEEGKLERLASSEGELSPIDVFKEMTTFTQDDFRRYKKGMGKVARETVEGTVDFTKGFFPTLGVALCVPYVLPSAIRIDDSPKQERDGYIRVPSISRKVGRAIGGVAGVVSDLIVAGYSLGLSLNTNAPGEFHPYLFSTWLGTNVASGVYEFARYKYRKAKKKLEEKRVLELERAQKILVMRERGEEK